MMSCHEVAVVPFSVVVQAKEDLHGDNDEGGSLQIVAWKDGMTHAVECVERLIRHPSPLRQPADPEVELI